MKGDQIDPTKPLHDAQREAFSVRVAAGEEAFAAFKAVFGKGSKVQAFQFREEPEIDARIAHLQEERAATMMATARESVEQIAYGQTEAMAEAEAARALAMTLGDARAAVAAIGLKAKMKGLLAEGGNKAPSSFRDLPLSTIMALLKEARDRRNAELMDGLTGEVVDVSPRQH